MKKLTDILYGIKPIKTVGEVDIAVSSIAFDSRKVVDNSLFVAVRGTQADGHSYISVAIEKGASAVICEDLPENINSEITYIQVNDSANALGIVAANIYDNPSQKIKLLGVTGTNGKTTIATLLYQLFESLGYKAGLISTIENFIHTDKVKATHTTPDSLAINALLNQMSEAGCEFCFMEVSSHAIDQKRIEGLQFTGGIFTNITHDHLDYHKDFQSYIKAKKAFFDGLPKNAFALTNTDDKNGIIMMQNTKAKQYTYSLKNMADFKIKILENHFDGTLLEIQNREMWTRLIGQFNAYNLIAVYATAILLEQNEDEILTELSNQKPVNGRFETLKSANGVTAIVDYAHTPDALFNVLKTINNLREDGQKLITVIGAGGDRDKTKRPLMAKTACENSDKVILTSDNPRTENPNAIISDMEQGIELQHKRKVLSIVDRQQAIKTACMLAERDAIILVAGKGHETYQEINGVRTHFDDKEIIREQFSMLQN